MTDKEEAEWILEKLFLRLEDELQRERKLAKKLRAKEAETGKKQETPKWPLTTVEERERSGSVDGEEEEKDNKSSESSKTSEGQSSTADKDSRPTSSENTKGPRRVSMEEGKDSRLPRLE